MRPLIAIPAIAALIYRAYSRRSLTPIGLVAAALTAAIHALHPSAVPFTLLGTFFILGTAATKVKHEVKATLTLSSSGSSGGEGPRTTVQVFANSACASLLCLLQAYKYGIGGPLLCFGGQDPSYDLILVGIVCNYVSVAADTLSSELGILSKSKPVLITNLRSVPPGTNGGVTLAGLVAGMGGSAAIAATTLLLLPVCTTTTSYTKPPLPGWPVRTKLALGLAFTLWGTLGSLLDSLLGAVLQASVIDRRTGKIVEGAGGVKVLTRPSGSSPRPSSSSSSTVSPAKSPRKSNKSVAESRLINSGNDLLDNNQINLLMAATMTIGGMLVASTIWGTSISQLFRV